MLFIPPGTSKMIRVHAPFVSEEEPAGNSQSFEVSSPPRYNETIVEDGGEKGELRN